MYIMPILPLGLSLPVPTYFWARPHKTFSLVLTQKPIGHTWPLDLAQAKLARRSDPRAFDHTDKEAMIGLTISHKQLDIVKTNSDLFSLEVPPGDFSFG